MRIETVTSPPTLGAGRVWSWTFPFLGTTNAGSMPNSVAGLIGQRPLLNNVINQTAAPGMSRFLVGVPPTTGNSLACIYQGRYCISVNSDGTTGQGWTIANTNSAQGVMPFVTVKGGQPPGLEDWNVWELSAILAFDQVAGAVTGDIGFGFSISTRAIVRSGPQAGVEVGPRNVGSIGIVSRQTDAGGLTIDQALTVQPTDFTLWNNYTIRLIGATANSEAQLKVLVNGTPAFTANWGAGSLLPEQSLGGATAYGFCPFIVNSKAVAGSVSRMYVPTGGVSVRAAPTEDMLA